jgi:hypothetical protein
MVRQLHLFNSVTSTKQLTSTLTTLRFKQAYGLLSWARQLEILSASGPTVTQPSVTYLVKLSTDNKIILNIGSLVTKTYNRDRQQSQIKYDQINPKSITSIYLIN